MGDLSAALAAGRWFQRDTVFVGLSPGPVLRTWFAAEIERRRLFLWLPVAVGIGIILYFSADTEPNLPVALASAACACALALWLRRRGPGAALAMAGAACVLSGFAAGCLRTWTVAGPVVARPQVVKLTAFVESLERRVEGGRLVLRPIASPSLSPAALPQRVRVVVPHLSAIRSGDVITGTARLLPPPVPSRPGGYHFARDAFFSGLGAVGSMAGAVNIVAEPPPVPLSWHVSAAIDRARNTLTDRIAQIVGGAAGGVATALVTGKRGLIPENTNEDLRAAGIYHVVSISGLHMVLAAGMVFWLVRAGLALSPGLALHAPIKKIAASAAMVAGCAYTVFAGGDVATVRSLIMTIALLGAVLADRPALSMRNLALAALLTLLVEPETLLSPGFQMSFAAVAALIAVFERAGGAPGEGGAIPGVAAGPAAKSAKAAALTWPLRLWASLRRHAVSTVVTTLVAEGATATYSLYHFQRLTMLGLVGNALTLPIVSLVIMPAALMGVVAYPFGLDGPIWSAMGLGVHAMLEVSAWIAAIPGAQRAVPAFDLSAMLLLSAALTWLTLWQTPLRFAGVVLALLGVVVAARSGTADIVAAPDGGAMTVRGADGRMVLMGRQSGDFAAIQWLRADGDLRAPQEVRREGGQACDPRGCVVRMPDGRAVVHVRSPLAFGEDCARAAIIVTALIAPQWCRPPLLLDRRHFDAHGATAIRVTATGFAIATDRTPLQDRPWMPVAATRPGAAPAPPDRGSQSSPALMAQTAKKARHAPAEAAPSPKRARSDRDAPAPASMPPPTKSRAPPAPLSLQAPHPPRENPVEEPTRRKALPDGAEADPPQERDVFTTEDHAEE